MASSGFPDIFTWLQNLPAGSLWRTNSVSTCICPSHPSLNLTIAKNSTSSNLSFSIMANFNLPISLWTSKPFKSNPNSSNLLDETAVFNLMVSLIENVLSYGVKRNSISIKIPKPVSVSSLKDMFNLAFLTLAVLVCIYEAPTSLRSSCLNTLKNYLVTCKLRQGSRSLMTLIGSNLEEQWMRSLNLAITNWIMELRGSSRGGHHPVKTPSPLFSYVISTLGLWKVNLYCPVIAMETEQNSSNVLTDERLAFSLNYHQLEGVIQFNYRVVVHEKWVNIVVNTDNVRCDIIRLVSETLMSELGAGADEKHFPSRISLQLTPTLQTNILSVSVSKSSANPAHEIEVEKTINAKIEPPDTFFSLEVSAGQTTVTTLKPWEFEQSVYGYSANLTWSLHDMSGGDGREVASSRPSKVSAMNPKSWFRNRYSSALRPFTREGGVVFARDRYGESVCWKVNRAVAAGTVLEWEIRGCVWLTYWPNRYNTSYNETRRLEFREMLYLSVG